MLPDAAVIANDSWVLQPLQRIDFNEQRIYLTVGATAKRLAKFAFPQPTVFFC